MVLLSVVFGCFILFCTGAFAVGIVTARSMQTNSERKFADAEAWEKIDALSSLNRMQRYNEFVKNGDYADDVELCDGALQEDSDDAMAHNNKAWLLATCPDDEVRD